MIAFRKQHTYPIGLHLGTQTATLVQLAGANGKLEVHALAHDEIPCNESASAEEQDREVAAALRKLIADHHFRGRQVVSCLGVQQLFVQNVRLPKLPPEEVEKVVRWEAEERLPYPVAEAEMRYLTAGEVRQDANVKQEVILLACHQGVLNRHLSLLEMAGLVPASIDVEPCAILRCLHAVGSIEPPPRKAYLHIGERATVMIIAEGRQVLFLKYISSGSRHLNQATARHLNVPLPEATRIREEASAAMKADEPDELQRSVLDGIRTTLESMTTEVELCLRYYKVTFRGQPLTELVLAGGEARPWLADFFTDRLGLSCAPADPFAQLSSPPAAGRVGSGRWATALGLSLKLTV